MNDRGSGHYDLLYKAKDPIHNLDHVRRTHNSPYEEAEDLSRMNRLLFGAEYTDCHNHDAGAVQLKDPIYQLPYSTLNTLSAGRAPGQRYVAGGFEPEIAPYPDNLDEDTLWCTTASVSISHMAAPQNQARGWKEHVSQLGQKVSQEGQARSKQEMPPSVAMREVASPREFEKCPIREVAFLRKDEREPIGKSYDSWSELVGKNLVVPDPHQSTAFKSYKEE